MAELVDALDSKSGELYAHEGSIPSWGTDGSLKKVIREDNVQKS